MVSFGAALVAPAATPTPAQDARQNRGRLTVELAERLVGELVSEVEKLRELSFERPVPVEVIDFAAARRHVEDRLESFQALEQMAEAGRAYELLGLLPPGSDVLGLYLDALDEQAGGFYNPTTGSYYLLEDIAAVLAPSVTVHELTHAIEDQHYDLDGRMREVIGDDDRLFALSAVHEGSATLMMSAYLARRLLDGETDLAEMAAYAESEAGRTEALTQMPPVLLRQLLGPYVLGALFLARGESMTLPEGYPATDVARAFADGPVSSEQILHPERYWDPGKLDLPTPVTLDGIAEVLGSRWARRADGVMGEITLAVLVGADSPVEAMVSGDAESWTNAAAAGWDGDRWELWARDERAIVIVRTIWDTPRDAAEFVDALPSSGRLSWASSGREVALVAGRLGKKRRQRLLSAILGR